MKIDLKRNKTVSFVEEAYHQDDKKENCEDDFTKQGYLLDKQGLIFLVNL